MAWSSLATSDFDLESWEAVVQAFAVTSSFLAVASGYVAWIARRANLTVGEVADAAGLGLAIAFSPSMLAGGYAYLEVLLTGPI